MNGRKQLCVFTFLLALVSALLVGQNRKESASQKYTEKSLSAGNLAYEKGNYKKALSNFLSLLPQDSSNADLLYKIGICYLKKDNEQEKSLRYFLKAYAYNSKLKDINFYLGCAYHESLRFTDALGAFEDYLKENPPIMQRNLTEHLMEFCKNGEILVVSTLNKLIIENIGPPINTEFSEYVPLLNSDGNVLIYTYLGENSTGSLKEAKLHPDEDIEYDEDVFISNKNNGNWSNPQSIGPLINTTENDAGISLSFDGQKLFIFRSTPKDNGDIYMSTLEGDTWGTPLHLPTPINSKYWEGSASLSADEHTIYFSSERPGGFGGRDLYKSEKQSNGTWGPAVNLGPTINTKYDEDAPFIHPDGKTFFFSSTGHNTIGGYDVFTSVLEDGVWSTPINMGPPINTPGNDICYILTPDGETGYFSSNRKGGHGEQDIYMVTPGLRAYKPALAIATGKIFLNEKPVMATIKIEDLYTANTIGEYKSNSETGKYSIAFKPGIDYRIMVSTNQAEPYYEIFHAKSLKNYVKIKHDFHLYTEDAKPMVDKHDSVRTDHFDRKMEEQLLSYEEEKIPSVYEEHIYSKLLEKFGNIVKDSIHFNVDLGTYSYSMKIDTARLHLNGPIVELMNPDSSFNYYSPGYLSLNEAEAARQELLRSNSDLNKHTSVTVEDHGYNKLVTDYYQAAYTKSDYTPRTKADVIQFNGTPSKNGATHTQLATVPGSALQDSTGKTYDLSYFKGKSLNDPLIYKLLLKKIGLLHVDELSYYVQVGAYRHPENFKRANNKIANFDVLKNTSVGDGIARFTIGEFKTLNESEILRKKASATGITDAWITATYKGKRLTLEELIPLNFYSTPIN